MATVNSEVLSYKCAIFSLLIFILSNSADAQFFESGVAPASVRWQQINTKNFRIIFPDDAAAKGQRVANVLEYIHYQGGKTLSHAPSHIPVVLHNRTSFSNGFVSWTPKRSEMFLTPPQSNYAQEWLSHLAIHEYRHVVQIDKLNQGFTRAMGIVTGQQAVGMTAGLLPRWFLEGDAIATETAFSNTGRGRDPSFEMPLRTIALSDNFHKYDKALFGSYRDHVPNHYETGYQIVGWTREQYGVQTFETAIDFVAQNPFSFFRYPFSIGLKKGTGHSTAQLYNNAFNDLTYRWYRQQAQSIYENTVPITVRTSNIYTNYRSPHYLNDGSFVALKSGIANIAQLVKVHADGKEQNLHTPGILNSERISYSNGLLAWTEQVQDVRWSNRTYSIVKIYDINTGHERTLQRRTRFFSPTISPDGATVAVVEITIDGVVSILLLDAKTGNEKMRLPNDNQALLQTPAWTKDGKSLLTIVNDGKNKSIVRIDVETGLYTTLMTSENHDISNPVDGGKYALFNSCYNGIMNIYAFDYLSGEAMQVSSSRFGAFDPQTNETGDKIIFADYSIDGYSLVEINSEPEKWVRVERLRDNSLKLFRTLVRQEGFNLHDSIIPNNIYDIKPYRKWTNLFNVHSWAPLYYNVDVHNATEIDFHPGVVVLSQDLLGNLTSSAGYSWRRDYGVVHANFTYKGLYPVFDVNINHGGPVLTSYAPPRAEEYSNAAHRRNTDVYVRSYIPFVFTRSRWHTGFSPQITLLYDNRHFYSPDMDDYKTGYSRLSYGFSMYRYQKTSQRDLAPRLGFIFQGAFLHTPWNSEQFGDMYYLWTRIFLPGIAPHHSLQLTSGCQHQKAKTFGMISMLSFPRGYLRGFSEKLNFVNFDYAFPIFYPDWNFSYFIYLKRLQTNLFCDIAQNGYYIFNQKARWHTDDMLSVGIDLLADVHLMRIIFPFKIGVRTAYLPDIKEIKPFFLFNVNF